MPEPARTIVYRHPCDCDTASRPLAEGEQAEHQFDVDGEPFPWLITDVGAEFHRLDIDPRWSLYICTVTILDLDPETKEYIGIRMPYGWPEIGGKQFPWSIHTCTLKLVCGQMQTTVEFIAEHVDTDGPIG